MKLVIFNLVLKLNGLLMLIMSGEKWRNLKIFWAAAENYFFMH